MNKIIFSGIQPTGVIHIGNYLGAIKQWADLQHQAETSIFCIVDLHAITVPKDPEALKRNIYSMAALYLAAGIDPQKSSLFVQSSRPEHTELAWILNCFATMGELGRMTQFKDKGGEKNDRVTVGLFDYPVLMAADILLYGTTHVPVGDDQKQHVELTRDIADRFNSKYPGSFVLPEPLIDSSSARIMALDEPNKKMSKSAASSLSYIAITDTPDDIKSKIKRAVTDSGSEIKHAADKPAISNLLDIYSAVSGRTLAELESDYSNKGYGEFKSDLADALVQYLEPIQSKFTNYLADRDGLNKILSDGAAKIAPMADDRLSRVKKCLGLGL